MPTMPSTTTSGACPSSGVHEPTTGRQQCREPGLVVARPQQQHVDGHAATAQQRSGVQRITAVVAGADQEQHPPAVAAAEEVEHGVGEAGGRALHQDTVGQLAHQRCLGGTHLGDGVGETHRSDATDQLWGIRNTWPGKIRSGFSMLLSLAISW